MVSIASASALACALAFALAFAFAITYRFALASDSRLLKLSAGPHPGVVLHPIAFCVTVQHVDRQACAVQVRFTQKDFSPIFLCCQQ